MREILGGYTKLIGSDDTEQAFNQLTEKCSTEPIWNCDGSPSSDDHTPMLPPPAESTGKPRGSLNDIDQATVEDSLAIFMKIRNATGGGNLSKKKPPALVVPPSLSIPSYQVSYHPNSFSRSFRSIASIHYGDPTAWSCSHKPFVLILQRRFFCTTSCLILLEEEPYVSIQIARFPVRYLLKSASN